MDYFFLLLFAALVWFWLDSLRANEIAKEAGRRACLDVQFLDDTVRMASLSLSRNSGRLSLRRVYRFEFRDTGAWRLDGEVVLKGHGVESVKMDPYRMML
jgi:hypothetical protein